MGINMLLTIGGIVLLTTFVLYANGLMFDNTKIASDNEYVITAISLAQSIIDEAKTKAFDELTLLAPVTSPGGLTPVHLLGPDGASEALASSDTINNQHPKSISHYDDVDDYNGYIRIVNTPRAEGFRIQAAVNYVSETNPDSVSALRTFCKRMLVTVTSPYFAQPVSLTYAFTY